MKLEETIILWNPKTSGPPGTGKEIKLAPFPLPISYDDDFRNTTGACYVHVRDLTENDKTRFLFIEAMKLIARDGMDPQYVHNVFCEIREYRNGLPPDTPVPRHLKEKFRKEIENDL